MRSKRRSMGKYVLMNILALVLVIGLMPVQALADDSHTWGEGTTDDEERKSAVIVNYNGNDHKNPDKINWIRYKSGDYKPFTFTNMDNKFNIDKDGIDATKRTTIAQKELTDWAKIAAKIFKHGSTIGGKQEVAQRSGVTADLLYHDWDYYFETDRQSHGQINLPDWLSREDKKGVFESMTSTDWVIHTSGIRKANSLADVRDEMVKEIADHGKSYDFTEDMIYKQRSSDTQSRNVLSQMNDARTKKDGVYYTVVTHLTHELSTGITAYNCYAVALYDLCRDSLAGDGLYYHTENDNHQDPTDDPDNKKLKTPHIHYNTSEQEEVGTAEYTLNYAQSNTITHATTTGWNRGFTAGGAFEIGTAEKCKLPFSLKINIHGDANFSWQKQDTDEKSETMDTDKTADAQATSSVMPHTQKTFTPKAVTATESGDYTDPVYINYKVAICSISGAKPRRSSHMDYPADFCTFFEPATTGGGADAITNLYMRRMSGNSGEDYGKTEGYWNGHLNMSEVDWSNKIFNSEKVEQNGTQETMSELLAEKQTTIPMVSQGMAFALAESNYSIDIGKCIPIYPLSEIRLEDETKEVLNITAATDEYDLSAIKVQGYDGGNDEGGQAVTPVPYYGFQPTKGYWKVMYPDTVADEDKVLVINTDPVTGHQVLKASSVPDESVEAYLEWHMNDEICYKTASGFEVHDKNFNGYRADVEVKIHGVYEGYNLEFRKKTGKGYAGESINLQDVLPVDVKDKDGHVRSHDVEYFLNDSTISEEEAKISQDGEHLTVNNDYVPAEGKDYEIRAKYHGVESPDTDIATVTVKPARQLKLVTSSASQVVKPAMEANGETATFEIMNYIDYTDQYGDPWPEDRPDAIPTWKFTLAEGDPTAEITQLGFLTVKKPGVYKVNANVWDTEKDECKYSAGTVTFTVTENPNQVAVPEPYEDLTYTGSTQTCVPEGEGYTITGNRARDVGVYRATATLDDEDYDWSDGYPDRSREITYEIKPKVVKKPTGKTGLVYNGAEQVGVPKGEGYSLSGETATKAGTYNAIATLDSNCIWDDNTVSADNIEYTINKAKVNMPKATSLTYNGKTQTAVKGGSGYTLSGEKAKNAGKYTATAKLNDAENYCWSSGSSDDLKLGYTVNKAKNPMKVKVKKATVKRAKLKKKAVTLSRSKVMSISKAQGKLSYAKASGNKKITVNKKNGKVTVKKGLKKGTYKVKAKVKAKGNKNYKSLTKTVTFKIQVR